jgi:hypothetical protein
MKKMILVSSLLFGLNSLAMISPAYMYLRNLDTAATAMATQVMSYETEDELPISEIAILENGEVQVTTQGQACLFEMAAKPLPPGAVGVPGLTAKVIQCGTIREDLKTLTYDKILDRLNKAASMGKQVTGVKVTKTGKIKLTYKK